MGALWGSIVFPVIVSLYWDKVNARAFNWSVGLAFLSFLIVRFEWLPIQGLIALGFELVATLGIGVVLGLMTFGFFGKKWAWSLAYWLVLVSCHGPSASCVNTAPC